jgi:DNA-binding response OmpR family regulator
LTARVKALLRRARLGSASPSAGGPGTLEHGEIESVGIGSLKMDFIRHNALLNGEPLELTAKEFELLGLFMKNPGRAYSRADLLRLVWGYDFEGYEHTVNTHINRLRNKIETDPSKPKYLTTVWGIGYRFVESMEVEA